MNTTENPDHISRLAWHTTSYCGAEGGECVEVAMAPAAVHIRDSTFRHGPSIAVSHEAWAAFVTFATQRGAPHRTSCVS